MNSFFNRIANALIYNVIRIWTNNSMRTNPAMIGITLLLIALIIKGCYK